MAEKRPSFLVPCSYRALGTIPFGQAVEGKVDVAVLDCPAQGLLDSLTHGLLTLLDSQSLLDFLESGLLDSRIYRDFPSCHCPFSGAVTKGLLELFLLF